MAVGLLVNTGHQAGDAHMGQEVLVDLSGRNWMIEP